MQNTAQPDGPLVLVVEDDQALRELFHDLLDEEGYRTIMATDGAEALDLALSEAPAIILLDLGPGLLDGPSFCRAYRERGGAAPVILVTVANQQTAKEVLAACGAVAYILKPFNVERVLDTIERFAAV